MTYHVRLYGDHGFVSGGSFASLPEAEASARESLERNSYFRGAAVWHKRAEVSRVYREEA